MPSSVTELEEYSFAKCTSLFKGNYGIETTNEYYVGDFFKNIQIIRDYAFTGDKYIIDLKISNATTIIGHRAFFELSNRLNNSQQLLSVTIGSNDGTGSQLRATEDKNASNAWFGKNYATVN
jgi:hypothetical protein